MPFYTLQAEVEYDDDLSDNDLFDVLVPEGHDDAAWEQGNYDLDTDPEHPLWVKYPDATNISVNAVVSGPNDEPQAGNYLRLDTEEPGRTLLAAFGEEA